MLTCALSASDGFVCIIKQGILSQVGTVVTVDTEEEAVAMATMAAVDMEAADTITTTVEETTEEVC